MTFMHTLMRILNSRKVQTAVIGLGATIGVEATGVDYSGVLTQAMSVVTILLVGIQGALDWRFGSPSDGTDKTAG